MPLHFKDYQYWTIERMKKTPGGDTYYINDKPTCFAFTKSHRLAIKALTDGGSGVDPDVIDDDVVDRLLEDGKILINDDDCVMGHGWMGCAVWDGNGEYIGTVGDRCAQPAGYKTEHAQYGRCICHGGNMRPKMSNLTTGRTAKSLRRLVHEKVKAYADDPSRMDLSRELAIQRTMLDLLLDKLQTFDSLEHPDVDQLVQTVSRMAERVATSVDKMSAIKHRTALTVNQVMYVQVTVVDIIKRYLSPEDAQLAADELADRLGTKQAFGVDVTKVLTSGEDDVIDMPSTRRVVERTIDG